MPYYDLALVVGVAWHPHLCLIGACSDSRQKQSSRIIAALLSILNDIRVGTFALSVAKDSKDPGCTEC